MKYRTSIVFSGFLALYGVFTWILAGPAHADFPSLHIALDASNAMLSGLFALFLWGSARFRERGDCRGYLALAFALVAASELLHALVGAEWSGSFARVAAASQWLRPATWPPSTYFLPLAMALALPAARRRFPPAAFAAALLLLLAGLYGVFLALPSYVDSGILAIRRPFQIPLLPLLAGSAWLYWRERGGDPLHTPLVACSALLFLSDTFMLWSAAPHDNLAMIAHVGKFLAYLWAHGAMLRLSLDDTLARNRAEAELRASIDTLRASEQRFRLLLVSAPDPTIVSAADGRIAMVNHRAEALFGYAEAELLGQRIEILVPRRSREQHAAQRQGYHARPSHRSMEDRGELRAVAKDGREFPVEISLSPLETDAGRVVVSAIHDISDRKLLERQMAERTADLLAANRELQAFTYAASHDLKSPLGRIASFSALLERNYRDRLEGDGLLFLDFIRRNATRMTALIEDLLEHARIEQQKPKLKAVDARAAVQAVLNEKQEDIEQSGAQVRLDLPAARLLAEPQGLMQVLRNLLENALKYSGLSQPPRIEIGGQVGDGCCRLWVRDNGVGFDMAYHDRIFEIFRRLHTYEEFPGSGVGLALVRKAMERMDGRVWAESAPGAGATFYLELPLAEEAAAQADSTE